MILTVQLFPRNALQSCGVNCVHRQQLKYGKLYMCSNKYRVRSSIFFFSSFICRNSLFSIVVFPGKKDRYHVDFQRNPVGSYNIHYFLFASLLLFFFFLAGGGEAMVLSLMYMIQAHRLHPFSVLITMMTMYRKWRSSYMVFDCYLF